MLRAFKSSWWVHLPALIAIAAMIAIMAIRRPWPRLAPVHFNFYFKSDRWGSPWEFSAFPIIALWIALTGMLASALWARQENGRKRFNLVLPIIVAPLGGIVGIHFWFWWNLPTMSQTGNAPGGWIWFAVCAALLCCASILLELRRQPVPQQDP